MSERRIYYQLPMAQGFALLTDAIEGDPNFTGERVGPGYIGQEIERRKRSQP